MDRDRRNKKTAEAIMDVVLLHHSYELTHLIKKYETEDDGIWRWEPNFEDHNIRRRRKLSDDEVKKMMDWCIDDLKDRIKALSELKERW